MAGKKPGPKSKDVIRNGIRYEGLRKYTRKQNVKGKLYKKTYHVYDYLDEQGKKHREYFSENENEAIFQFEKSQIEREKYKFPVLEIDTDLIPSTPVLSPSSNSSEEKSEDEFFKSIGLEKEGYIEWQDVKEEQKLFYDTYDDDGMRRIGINEDLYWATVKYQLENYPVKFATKVDKEQIKYLDNLKPIKSLTLNELEKMYFDNRVKPLCKKTERDYRAFWKTFCKVVAVRYTRDIDFDKIEKYKEFILNEANKLKKLKKGGNARWVNNRYYCVKTIFNNVYEKKGAQYPDIDRILKHCKIFKKQDEPSPNPQPISVEHYGMVLKYWSNDPKFKALLLLSLNCGFKTGEVAQVLKSDIDFGFNSLSMVRQKKKTIRVACLWDRTIEAIKVYQKRFPHKSEYLFLNEDDNPMTSQNVRRKWNVARKNLNIPKEIVFDHIRDASETIPASYGFKLEDIKYLLGHRTGIPDRYLRRSYVLVQGICDCIEKHFFKDFVGSVHLTV